MPLPTPTTTPASDADAPDLPARRSASSGCRRLMGVIAQLAWFACPAPAPASVGPLEDSGPAAGPESLNGELQVGRPAPPFSATDSAGQVHRLADLRGKTVVLEWTNADCPYTRKHYSSGNMQNLQELARRRGVVWLSVISSAPGKQGYVSGPAADALTRSRHAAPTAVLLDPAGDLGRLYHAKTTPHLFVIDAKGELRYMGGIDSIATADVADIPKAEPYLKEALLSVVEDRPVAHPVTRPYGCSIKY
jgi:peroxiredoxin